MQENSDSESGHDGTDQPMKSSGRLILKITKIAGGVFIASSLVFTFLNLPHKSTTFFGGFNEFLSTLFTTWEALLLFLVGVGLWTVDSVVNFEKREK